MAVQTKDMNIYRDYLYEHPWTALDGVNWLGNTSLDGVTYAAGALIASTGTSINDRWHNIAFGTGVNEAAFMSLWLPDSYVPGDIILEIDYTSPATTGNAYMDFGMVRTSSGGVYTDAEAETEYSGLATITVDGTANKENTASFTFDGSAVTGGRILSFLFLRNGASGTDTLANDFIISGGVVKYKVKEIE